MLRRSARILSQSVSGRTLEFYRNFSTKSLSVIHDKTGKRFYVSLDENKDVAELNYEDIGGNTLDLYHTEVPKSFQGLGVAKILAKAAFDHCVDQDLKMKLTCTYLQKYYRENSNPQYSSRAIIPDF